MKAHKFLATGLEGRCPASPGRRRAAIAKGPGSRPKARFCNARAGCTYVARWTLPTGSTTSSGRSRRAATKSMVWTASWCGARASCAGWIAWGVNGRQRFASACVEHAAAQVTETVADAFASSSTMRVHGTNGYVTISAYTAALALGRIVSQEPSAYRREREWQSAWIASELLATHMPTR